MEEVLDGLHVLVVDDEPDVRRATVQLLRSHGAKAVVAANAADALDILELLDIDVVVSDIDMLTTASGSSESCVRDRPSSQSLRSPSRGALIISESSTQGSRRTS